MVLRYIVLYFCNALFEFDTLLYAGMTSFLLEFAILGGLDAGMSLL